MQAKKAFYFIIGACAAIVLMIGAALYIGGSILRNEAHNIAVARAEDEAADEQIIAVTALQAKINELGEIDELAQKFLPSEKDQSAVIAEIYQYASDSGVQLNNLGFSPTTEGPSGTSQTKELKGARGVRVFPFTSSIDCISASTLTDFLNKLELNRRKMQITVLNIQRVSESTPTCAAGNLNISSLEIEVYLKV